MFTYKILRKEDSGSLFVRILKDRKKAEFKLGVSATQEEFDKACKLSTAASKQRLACYLRNIVGRLDAIKQLCHSFNCFNSHAHVGHDGDKPAY